MSDRGRLRSRRASGPDDLRACQILRARAFGLDHILDHDPLDDSFTHILVEDTRTGAPVACYRLKLLDAQTLGQSYAARHYDLTALHAFEGLMLELGRFCIDPARSDPDVVRLAWAGITAYVDHHDVRLLFGCASFTGTDWTPFAAAFDWLGTHHLAPPHWQPRVKSPDVVRYAQKLFGTPDYKTAMRVMPPLLRSYLMMGGWVSDHAVVDRSLNTLHVFTGVEVASIPPARQRLLRALISRREGPVIKSDVDPGACAP